MGNNNSQSQEKPVSLEARLGQIMRQAREKSKQQQKAKEADYDKHNQRPGGHGQGVNIRGEPINTNRFNVSRQKSSKRKSSRQKSPKRKGSRQKSSKRKGSKI